jgi:hypothetical protein
MESLAVQFKTFKTFKPFKPSPPFDAAQETLSLRDAGEDEEEGLNDLNADYLGIELWPNNRQLLTSGM